MQKLFLLAALLGVSVHPAFAQAWAASYEVRYPAPNAHSIQVSLQLKEPRSSVTFVFPRAVPMGYSNLPYDHFVHNLRAKDEAGKPLEVTRGDGPRWILGNAASHVSKIEYEVDLEDMERQILGGGDSSRVRQDYVYLLGYSVFGFIEGTEMAPLRVTVDAPPEWPVCATLAPASPCPRGQAQADAKDFYALADSQIQMGSRFSYEQVKTTLASPLFVSIYAETEVDHERIIAASREAYEALATYFGNVPFPAYTALFEFLQPRSPEHTYGFSMEHLQSATFCLQPERALTKQSSTGDAERFRFNIAHHISHAWVPKRAYGQGYFPFTWEVAPAHDSIWFSEGFGQYAALEAMSETLPASQREAFINRLMEARYRSTLREMPRFLLEMPLDQLSYRGSFLYSEDFRVGRTLFSRGALMAHEMDQRIRQQTKDAKRMRDAFRYLMTWSARNKRSFRIAELPAIFQEATGVDTRDILHKWLGPVREGMVPPRQP